MQEIKEYCENILKEIKKDNVDVEKLKTDMFMLNIYFEKEYGSHRNLNVI